MPYFITTKNKIVSVDKRTLNHKSPNPRKILVARIFDRSKQKMKKIQWNERSGRALNHKFGDLKKIDIVTAERRKYFDNSCVCFYK